MESNWASEHLQTIRTLMERSAVYRRALAPVMTFNGVVGTLAAVAGVAAGIDSPQGFIAYWLVVSVVAVAGSLLLTRRQALKDAEPFWSPPTRRVTQALLPPLVVGFVLSLILFVRGADPGTGPARLNLPGMLWLPSAWVALYGCALHAAGFFMPRGMKIFGWLLALCGCALLAAGVPDWVSHRYYPHAIMGICFGLLHLAYGVYLYFTEQRRNET
jgi:membrane protease YdiL (CAAX protease family)